MKKLTFISDLHYYSKTLGTDGRQYFLRSGSDQKCLAESGDIIDAAFEKIAASDTDAVMIAGDLTNNGEIVSHIELREKLYKLKQKKKVYVITSTHDWCCDGNPRRFCGGCVSRDVDVMPSGALPEFYKDFGPDEAISVFTTHIGTCSYVVQLGKGLRLLALNDDKNGNHHAGYTNEHFEWIEQQLRRASDDNCLVIGMQHHLLTPHINPLITGGSVCVENREKVAARLAKAGLKYMFVGHSHMQSTAAYISPDGNKIIEVNIGALTGYPAPIVNVTVNDNNTLSYEVEHLKNFKLGGISVDAQQYLKKHALSVIHRLLDSSDKNELADRLTALQLNGKKAAPFSKILLKFFKFVKTATVSDLYSNLRHLKPDKYISPDLIEKFADTKLLDIADLIMLNMLDGSTVKFGRDDDFYKLMAQVSAIPNRFFKNSTDAKRLIFTVDAILTGGAFNNQKDTI